MVSLNVNAVLIVYGFIPCPCRIGCLWFHLMSMPHWLFMVPFNVHAALVVCGFTQCPCRCGCLWFDMGRNIFHIFFTQIVLPRLFQPFIHPSHQQPETLDPPLFYMPST